MLLRQWLSNLCWIYNFFFWVLIWVLWGHCSEIRKDQSKLVRVYLSWPTNKENCAMQEWIIWEFKSCCLLGLGRKVLGWWRGQVLPKWVCYSKLLHGKSLLWKNLHDVISLTYGVCRTFMVTFNQALHSWKLSPPSIRGVLLSLHAKVV